MTPLAYRIVKQLTLPRQERNNEDPPGLLWKMADVHCFEITDIRQTINNSVLAVAMKGCNIMSGFLPFQKTWLEYKEDDGFSCGLLLEETGSGFRVTQALETEDGGKWRFISTDRGWMFPGRRSPYETLAGEPKARFIELAKTEASDWWIFTALLLINSPKVVNMKSFQRHRGLEKRLLKERKLIGKFPLHAYTEIRLKTGEPKNMSGGEPIEARLTGMKCLHKCRAHPRFVGDQFIIVREHWRGDASLGIKRSRYKMTPGDNYPTEPLDRSLSPDSC